MIESIVCHFSNHVSIHSLFQSSYLRGTVNYPVGKVLAVENSLRLSGRGSDSGGGSTHELMTNIYNRFGPIASFTGSYRVDRWDLNIKQQPGSGEYFLITDYCIVSTFDICTLLTNM